MNQQPNELPLLRGSIESFQYFRNPQGGASPNTPVVPNRIPGEHRDYLLQALDAVRNEVLNRAPEEKVAGVPREIVAVTAEPGSDMLPEGLADKRTDVRLVSTDEESGTSLIDVPLDAIELAHVRRKAAEFADEDKRTPNGKLRNERLIAPISKVETATVDDLAGPDFKAANLVAGQAYWFELSCRGGSTLSAEETADSRAQISAVMAEHRLPPPQGYAAAELALFYVRVTLAQLEDLIRRTNCIYEFELVSKDLRTWVMLQAPTARAVAGFVLTPPSPDAPAVVLLDTGITPQHLLLSPALLSATSAVPGDASPIDVDGHGTEMAGVALYENLGDSLDVLHQDSSHWLQSSRILVTGEYGSASSENRPYWPETTKQAILDAETVDENAERRRAFVLAVSSESDQAKPTSWSAALDDAAYNDGAGRLLFVAIGNGDVVDQAIVDAYPYGNLGYFVDDPAQAANVVSIGGMTNRCEIPPDMGAYEAIAKEGGISPHTRAGANGAPIKPEMVLEAGNQAWDGHIASVADTMMELTTSHKPAEPLTAIVGTSPATAIAGRLAASVWQNDSTLWPETVRALLIHSARWTQQMMDDVPNLDDRLALCGYGTPNLRDCVRCLEEQATIIVEDSITTALIVEGEQKRLVKYFRLPAPDLLQELEGVAELSVTLSYFAQPSLGVRGRFARGLDLAWDMQGPAESEEQFMQRVNLLQSPGPLPADRPASYQWEIGKQRRSRGTVQSDRCTVPVSLLAGSRLIAVYPVLGWWDRRPEFKEQAMDFSLVVSLRVPQGIDVYNPIAATLAVPVSVDAAPERSDAASSGS